MIDLASIRRKLALGICPELSLEFGQTYLPTRMSWLNDRDTPVERKGELVILVETLAGFEGMSERKANEFLLGRGITLTHLRARDYLAFGDFVARLYYLDGRWPEGLAWPWQIVRPRDADAELVANISRILPEHAA